MRSGMASGALALISLSGIGLGLRVALAPMPAVALPERTMEQRADTSARPVGPADSLTRLIVERDLFRVARRPAGVTYDLVRAAQPPTPVPPKPALMLTGIVWDRGGNPSAVLDGVPGAGGPRVVRSGERIGALLVRRIERDRVVVVGLDTTWTLTVREPWR